MFEMKINVCWVSQFAAHPAGPAAAGAAAPGGAAAQRTAGAVGGKTSLGVTRWVK